mgnify:CR=1 FL=1
MQKYYYTYEEFTEDSKILSEHISIYKPDALLAVARGGLTLGHFIASRLKMRNVFALNCIHYDYEKKLDTFEIFNIPDLNNFTKVVIIDDIADSGETLRELLKVLKTKFPSCDFKVATIFYKPSSFVIPDFSLKIASSWIEFFWEFEN